MPQDSYQELWHKRFFDRLPARERFLFQVGNLFDTELLHASPLEDLRQPLAALRAQCAQRLWGLNKESLPFDIGKVMQNPPGEIFTEVSLDACVQQFDSMRLWLATIKNYRMVMNFSRKFPSWSGRSTCSVGQLGIPFAFTPRTLMRAVGRHAISPASQHWFLHESMAQSKYLKPIPGPTS